jgi:hypothetical protein
MTKLERMLNDKIANDCDALFRHWSFVLLSSFVIRPSTFEKRAAAAGTDCTKCASTMNLTRLRRSMLDQFATRAFCVLPASRER